LYHHSQLNKLTMETYKLKNGKTLQVFNEETPENPREWDNLSTMICFHRRYNLGDKHNYNHNDYSGWEEMKDAIVENESPAIILPLYLYDHSGITISTSPFSCGWDSGQIGWVLIGEDKLKREYDVTEITDEIYERGMKVLLSEVELYDNYLTGEVYGFTLLDENGEIEDSCSGYFGSDLDKNGILDAVGGELV